MLQRIFLAFAFASLSAKTTLSQVVTIPDQQFRVYLKNLPALRNCWVGEQLNTQCAGVAQVRSLRFSLFSNISQVTGVQYFTNLDTLDTSLLFNLFELPPLPQRLTYLNCSRNPLPLLPQLPVSLRTLLVEGCGMADLPPLPRGLRVLNCSFNPNLNFPPVFPDSLRDLSMINNQVSKIPTLPGQLRFFAAGFNQLKSLSSLPASLVNLSLNDNPIQCLPRLPATLRSISLARSNVRCLPNLPLGMVQMESPPLPVCSTGSPCTTSSTTGADPNTTCTVNRATDGMRIVSAGSSDPRLRFRLFNATGQLVFQSAFAANTEVVLPVSDVPGLYFYHIHNTKGSTLATGKVVL